MGCICESRENKLATLALPSDMSLISSIRMSYFNASQPLPSFQKEKWPYGLIKLQTPRSKERKNQRAS